MIKLIFKHSLVLIILLFLVSRLYKITEIPESVYWDEASIGYNAYAVGLDLKDEWGEFLPLHFRAFGEFKLPVYIYAVAFFVKVFGLNAFSVRLPAVLFSAGTIVVIYLLVAKITNNKYIGYLASFIFSFSPWMFIFSRTGFEATAGLFFFLASVYFCLRYLDNKFYILPASIATILSFYSYNSFRIIVPVFLLVWAIYCFVDGKIFKKGKKYWFELLAISIFILSLIPLIKLYRQDTGAARFVTVGVSEPKTIIANYLSHYDFGFLFIQGDKNMRHQQYGQPQLYWIELPFLLIGLLSVLRNKNKLNWILIVFLIIAPIPASLGRETPHALRSILLAPTLALIASIGIWSIYKALGKYKTFFMVGVVASYLVFFGKYFNNFISTYNQNAVSIWQFEYKELFTSYQLTSTNQEKVVINAQAGQPYIFALFYLKYPPQKFRSEVMYNPPQLWSHSLVASFGPFDFEDLK